MAFIPVFAYTPKKFIGMKQRGNENTNLQFSRPNQRCSLSGRRIMIRHTTLCSIRIVANALFYRLRIAAMKLLHHPDALSLVLNYMPIPASLGNAFLGHVPKIKCWYRLRDMLLYTGLRNTFGIPLLKILSSGLSASNQVGIEEDTAPGKRAASRTADDTKQAPMALLFSSDWRNALDLTSYQRTKRRPWTANVARIIQSYLSPWQNTVDY